MARTSSREDSSGFSLIRRLRRETTTGGFLPEVDGLRFVAILSVVLYHIFVMSHLAVNVVDGPHRVLEVLLGRGGRGVLLFFCISGFILGLPFARHTFACGPPVRLRAYFLRRLTRLEPPYLLNLFVRFPLVAAARHMSVGAVLPHLLASIVYLHTLIYGQMPLVHLPSWSLEVEVQFYILAPFLAALVYRGSVPVRRYGSIAFIVAATALQLYFRFPEGADGNATRASFSILNFAQFFLVGILAADWYYTVKSATELDTRLDFLGPLAILGFFYVPEPFSRVLLPFLGLAALWSALRSVRFKRLLSQPFFYIVGGMCYSLYLTHSLVLQFVYAAMAKLSLSDSMAKAFTVGCLVSLPAILAVGTGFYLLIERPCMDKNWPRKLAERLGLRAPAA